MNTVSTSACHHLHVRALHTSTKALTLSVLTVLALLQGLLAHAQAIDPAAPPPPPPDAPLHTNKFRTFPPPPIDPALISCLTNRLFLRTAINTNPRRSATADAGSSKANDAIGNKEDDAIRKAMGWFARTQETNGCWSGRLHGTPGSGSQSPIALTGLAMLSYMSYGQTHSPSSNNTRFVKANIGDHTQVMSNAVNWMLKQVTTNGALRDGEAGRMYDHSIGTYALCEAYWMTKDLKLKEPCERLIAYACRAQNPQTGGWRYRPVFESPQEPGDLSVSGFHIMALAAAKYGGLDVPTNNVDGAKAFLKSKSSGQYGGHFRYHDPDHPDVTLTMVAVGNYCSQLLANGERNDIGRIEEGKVYLLANLPNTSRMDYYYWFYGSYALHYIPRSLQGDPWGSVQVPAKARWHGALAPILLSKQVQGGTEDGSWSPDDVRFRDGYGRHVTTAFAVLAFGAPYRFSLMERGYIRRNLRDPDGGTLIKTQSVTNGVRAL